MHKKSLVHGNPNQWYIQYGTQSEAGYFSRPSLPIVENGDPIPNNFEARMRYPSRTSFVGFNLGQYIFMFDDCVSSRIETPGE